MLPQLAPQEQRDLVGLCVERVEVRAKSSVVRPDEDRQIEIRLRLHAAQLVAGMEERVVVRVREARLAPITHRVMTIDSRVNLGSSQRPTRILTPFNEVLAAASATSVTRKEPAIRHLLHLAIAWQRKLENKPDMSHAALARRKKVSEPTVSRTLQMLRLLPEIQAILLQLKQRSDLRRYSLNKMVALAALPPEEQRQGFAKLSL
ncbi:hypothetical protein OH491_19065 [Termitidicoccus mucosus]|uniref:Uncharacterized protein n=1 Tax=Termitidicoccus mucosus TaxID=1184151 RepID=A0A178IJG2_9BACT|nr:hypothetical protein AW736_09565 [Opitutaceae bacterium TSB47]